MRTQEERLPAFLCDVLSESELTTLEIQTI